MNGLSKETKEALNALHRNNFEAYVVGGYVRDMLMGKSPFDSDITTSALPEEIKKVFDEYKTIDTGIRHGTVTVIINSVPIEITTYRIDKGYSDGRHPDTVIFTNSLKEDLSRRDFTVNSIAYCEEIGFFDPFDGREDIKNKIIRCVGNPEKRFEEDALRILRALRFASTLSFDLDKKTEEAVFRCKKLLSRVSQERIFQEITKTLCGKNIKNILCKYSEVFEIVLPEIRNMKGFDQKNFHHIYDILTHTATVIENIPPAPPLRLAALFHDCGKADCFSVDENGTGHFYSHPSISAEKAEKALTRLHCDNKTKETVVKLVKIHDTPIEESERIIKRKLRSLGEELFFDLIKLQRADTKGLAPEYHNRDKHFDTLEHIAREIIKSEQCFSLRDLKINGNDLIAAGFTGKEIGTALNSVLESVIDGKTENEKEALLNFCKKLKNLQYG